MCQSHIVNPFHRISRWTGSYFREAALWEVGVYLTVKHQEAPDICPHLKWQQDILEQFQNQRDYNDKYRSEATSSRFVGNPGKADLAMSDPGPEPGEEAIWDATVMQLLDRLVEGHNIEDLLEEDEDNDTIQREAEIKDDEAGAFGFVGYIGDPTGTEPGLAGQPTAGLEPHIPVVPQQDALNNQYVRVVHMNGVHHIALVSCSCQGHEKMITDLIYAQLIPTSFTRIRTLFTTAVLDNFRYCNLEMKASAYQFFQLLRRITMPMNPSNVVNLYHELRRLS
jgi:hypothetical protein